MPFSTEDKVRLQQNFERIRTRLNILQNREMLNDWLLNAASDRPHILKRYEQLIAMSDEELMEEIEADYVLFGD